MFRVSGFYCSRPFQKRLQQKALSSDVETRTEAAQCLGSVMSGMKSLANPDEYLEPGTQEYVAEGPQGWFWKLWALCSHTLGVYRYALVGTVRGHRRLLELSERRTLLAEPFGPLSGSMFVW